MEKAVLTTANLQKTEMPPVTLIGGHRDSAVEADSRIVAIRRAMICWWSPIRQKCTNEALSDNPFLKDLSDNGNHLECKNFAWTEESGIQSDGALVFDGISDYCVCQSDMILTDFTIIAKRTVFPGSDRDYQSFATKSVSFENGAFVCDSWQTGKVTSASFRARLDVSYNNYFKDGIIWMTPTEYRNHTIMSPIIKILRGDKLDTTDSKIHIARIRQSSEVMTAATKLYDFILFDRTLTHEEIELAINIFIS